MASDKKLYIYENAEDMKKAAGKSYRPSNGTEGEIFQSLWCAKCAFEKAYRDSDGDQPGCEILTATMIYGVDSPGYPEHWIYDGDGQPKCTAFTDQNPPTEADRKYLEWKATTDRSAVGDR